MIAQAAHASAFSEGPAFAKRVIVRGTLSDIDAACQKADDIRLLYFAYPIIAEGAK